MREQFPILDHLVYANHAAMSPWPRASCEAVRAFALENARQGPQAYAEWLGLEHGLRARIARLLNAPSAGDIALTQNTSEGVCILANGLDWRPGDNLVTAGGEFPSNRLAWEALQEHGVELRVVDIRAADDAEAALAARFDRRTRLLAISAVQWNDGFRLDLERLGGACEDAGVLFFVDAIQQLGALPMDVLAARIDALSAGSHKWQMGPEGMGVFYCTQDLRDSLALRRHGWRMLDDPYRFDRPDREPSASARRFEPGSPNSMGQVALEASLGILEQVGMETVGRRVLENTACLVQAVEDIGGLELVSRPEPERRSGIVALRSARMPATTLFRELKRRQVVAALRDGAVRLSPHFYQHGEPLEALLNALADAAATS